MEQFILYIAIFVVLGSVALYGYIDTRNFEREEARKALAHPAK